MEIITQYLKGIEPLLQQQIDKNAESLGKEFDESLVKENDFISKLLKEIAELPAQKQGE
jgi:hypothetical protein